MVLFLLQSREGAITEVPPITEIDRQQIARRIRQCIERVGGNSVWVKDLPYAPFPPPRAEKAAEVVVSKPHFDHVLSAIESEAENQGLQATRKVIRGSAQMRLADLRLLHGRKTAGRWLVHEVPRICYAAIIIDDLGQDLPPARRLVALPYAITFAVLPHL
ncbi:MAG: hypothetical protein ACFFEK_16715, partial [Candidatus Thorarchaeota archaeon]